MQMVENFHHRAEECVRLAERATSNHDKDLFMELARAWYGLMPNIEQSASPLAKRPH